jgi:hypothetical protein
MFMHTTSHMISHTTSYAMFIQLDLELGSGGSNCMHNRAGTGVCMAMDSFRHQPPNQRRQGQAAPERHRHRTAAAAGCFGALGRFLLLRVAAARFRRERTRLDRRNTLSVRSMRVHSQVRMSSGGMRVQSQARMRACQCKHARMSRGGGAVSKRT